MVLAQLVEWSLSTPEIGGSNPNIGKILSTYGTIEKTKIKKNRPGMAHLLKQLLLGFQLQLYQRPGSTSLRAKTLSLALKIGFVPKTFDYMVVGGKK